ncbi:aminoglycoside phosphotransferase [Pseudoclavibacter sp. RFBJ3]|uniref:maltokinase N-terminal cap-like domain-containing protein n=1 Tax=unclassified Pseudoclavibacter TaxID=2615177 RepID=UPI000CE75171|nr:MULTISPECIES: aminoglycoside phosphotransferase [unclassified Pseudoclavibacter]PPF80443.1 aminoglycoside phosphotransferase [Pseudoclavibacter sp. RFBJ5]PPF90156.1 aminoglycoside phosphotransferase [Pseudoclavibacter sp. RFBJ3]PPG00489.1 aminoglycoside phosphotransferase [Pseudoclavibacter sp. RFBH5]PPG19231.1 aminoglycoside phosphotransferase [Pseudoclavibacter sp. RFBI4]
MTDLIHMLRDWMPKQRWYSGGEGRTPQLTHLGSYVLANPNGEAGVHLVTVPCILDSSGEVPVVYQVPIVLREVDARVPALGYIGSISNAAGRVSAVVDGPHDIAFARALLALLEREGHAAGAGGRTDIAAYGLPMPGVVLGSFVTSRVLSGEQSNSSIICEMRMPDGSAAAPLILKVFRMLHDGENPEVTLQSALAAAGSVRVPPAIGHLSGYWPDPRVSSGRASGNFVFAQEFLPGVEDAWRVALRAAETGDDFGDAAYTLGEATAEVHRTLREVLPSVEASALKVQAEVDAMRQRLDAAIAVAPALERLRGAAEEVYAHAAEMHWPTLQRVHGDLHLGQVLAVEGSGWVFLDFEGEPLRSIEQRNTADAPQRDIAGILRSFDYVAGSLEMTTGRDVAGDWAARARQSFLNGYAAAVSGQERIGRHTGAITLDSRAARRQARDFDDARGTRDARGGSGPFSQGGQSSSLPLSAAESAALIRVFELDKALYEVIYEASQRPAWLRIPVRAVQRILA